MFLVVLGCIGGGRRNPSTSSSGSSQSTNENVDASPPLELMSWRWAQTASDMFVEVNGEVRNVSDEKLDALRVTAEFRTKDGTLITTEDGMVESSPLLPEQTSSFKIMGRYNSEMATCNLRFKTIWGTEIDYTDKSKTNTPPPAKTKRKK